MRIISGTHRGTKLFTLEGKNTRPTLDRVKEALFNILQIKLQDAVVLDLFSGSGALALESISRGAKKAYLCDNSRDAINIIKKNIEKMKVQASTVVINKNYEKALVDIHNTKEKFDVIYLDPPYETDFAEKSVKYIMENDLLNEEGIIILETDNKEKVYKNLEGYVANMYDERKYGRVHLIFLGRKG